jgi:hypothetical protein
VETVVVACNKMTVQNSVSRSILLSEVILARTDFSEKYVSAGFKKIKEM